MSTAQFISSNPVPTASPAELDDFILRTVSDITAVDASTVNFVDRLHEDLGLDSLQSMELLSRISEAYDIDPDLEAAADVKTVADVVTFVRSYLG